MKQEEQKEDGGKFEPEDDLICITEAIKVVGKISKSTFYKLIRQGTLPEGRSHLGTRSVRWSRSELKELSTRRFEKPKKGDENAHRA